MYFLKDIWPLFKDWSVVDVPCYFQWSDVCLSYEMITKIKKKTKLYINFEKTTSCMKDDSPKSGVWPLGFSWNACGQMTWHMTTEQGRTMTAQCGRRYYSGHWHLLRGAQRHPTVLVFQGIQMEVMTYDRVSGSPPVEHIPSHHCWAHPHLLWCTECGPTTPPDSPWFSS